MLVCSFDSPVSITMRSLCWVVSGYQVHSFIMLQCIAHLCYSLQVYIAEAHQQWRVTISHILSFPLFALLFSLSLISQSDCYLALYSIWIYHVATLHLQDWWLSCHFRDVSVINSSYFLMYLSLSSLSWVFYNANIYLQCMLSKIIN